MTDKKKDEQRMLVFAELTLECFPDGVTGEVRVLFRKDEAKLLSNRRSNSAIEIEVCGTNEKNADYIARLLKPIVATISEAHHFLGH